MSPTISLEKIPGLGTFWWFDFYEPIDEIALREALIQEIQSFEKAYSRFLPDSYVTQLNTKRSLQNPTDEMTSLINLGQTLYTKTKGYFNFLSGKVLEGRGYNASYSFTATDTRARPANPLANIAVTKKEIILKGSENIDLGGFGKGFLVDKLVTFLKETFGLHYFLVNGGGDIFVTSNNGEPVELILEDPEKTDYEFSRISGKDIALCGSSPFKRRWKDKNTQKEYTHIINPKNLDTTIAISAFTTASTTLMADVFATTVTALNGELHDLIEEIENEKIGVLLLKNGKYVASPLFPELHFD